jgi:hypothetical protein
MSGSSDPRHPVEALAEQFLERKRCGAQPTLREYVERYPDLADEIRELFPALLMMENLGEESGGASGQGNPGSTGDRNPDSPKRNRTSVAACED